MTQAVMLHAPALCRVGSLTRPELFLFAGRPVDLKACVPTWGNGRKYGAPDRGPEHKKGADQSGRAWAKGKWGIAWETAYVLRNTCVPVITAIGTMALWELVGIREAGTGISGIIVVQHFVGGLPLRTREETG